MSDLKAKDMEFSVAKYVQGSAPIDNSHIHDNRYYTKAEIEDKLAEKSDLKPGLLTAGLGVKSFTYDGNSNAQVELNFPPISEDPSTGTADYPARLDHYHRRLFTGFGLVESSYDGSKETIFEVDPTVLGKEILTNGPGISDFIYDGSEPVSISINFGDKTEFTGTTNLVARRDHIHKLITAGSGIAAFSYNGSETASISVAWDNRDDKNITGSEELVARSDHGHPTINTVMGDGEFLADIELVNTGPVVELRKTFKKSPVEAGLTEGSVSFSVGEGQGLVYDWIVKEVFLCSSDLDLKDSKETVELIGSGKLFDTRNGKVYEFDGNAWNEIQETLKPGRVYANTTTKKGFFQYTDKLVQLWENKSSWQPTEAFVATSELDVKDSKEEVEKQGSGTVFDFVANCTWTFENGAWTSIPGTENLRPSELYINPATKKGYFKTLEGKLLSLWGQSGIQLDFAYVCEDEEDFEDSKNAAEKQIDSELTYVYYNGQVFQFINNIWTEVEKELRPDRIYANDATGKGFVFQDNQVKRLWESGKVKPPVFSYVCEFEEEVEKSKQEILSKETLTEEESFIYDLENNKTLQFNGEDFVEVDKKLRNWTTYVNTATCKGFFKYPKTVKVLWQAPELPHLPFVVRRGCLDLRELNILLNTFVFHDSPMFTWFSEGSYTLEDYEKFIETEVPTELTWFKKGCYTLEDIKDFCPEKEPTQQPGWATRSHYTVEDVEERYDNLKDTFTVKSLQEQPVTALTTTEVKERDDVPLNLATFTENIRQSELRTFDIQTTAFEPYSAETLQATDFTGALNLARFSEGNNVNNITAESLQTYENSAKTLEEFTNLGK